MLIAQEKNIPSLMSEAETRLNPENVAYDPAIAFSIYQKTASLGVKKAMNALGILYSQGLGTAQDTTMAITWFKKAIDAGYINAWYNLGQLYKEGIGVKQNFITAYHYYQKGSEAKSPLGYYGEGYMRYKGLGCEQSYTEAFRLFQKGIPNGGISSMYMIGLCYRNGYGTAARLDSARYWLAKSAAGNYQFAIDEMQAKEPENPDFASSAIAKNARTIKNTEDLKTFKAIKHYLPKENIAGEYSGYIIRYDWSGQHMIGKSRLKLVLSDSGNILSGIWTEDDASSASLSAKLTDNALVFNNTSYERRDHYNQQKPVGFEFRDASIQIVKTSDSILLAGNIKLWSTEMKEPEKPIFISLARDIRTMDSSKSLFATTAPDSVITGFLAYPNPFENSFQVRFTTLKQTTAVITLTDVLTGKIVYKQDEKLLAPGEQLSTVPAYFHSGIYILRLMYGGKVKSTLMVKK